MALVSLVSFCGQLKVCIGLTNLFDFKYLFGYTYIVQRHIFFAQEHLFQWHYVSHVYYSQRTPNTIFSTKTRNHINIMKLKFTFSPFRFIKSHQAETLKVKEATRDHRNIFFQLFRILSFRFFLT